MKTSSKDKKLIAEIKKVEKKRQRDFILAELEKGLKSKTSSLKYDKNFWKNLKKEALKIKNA